MGRGAYGSNRTVKEMRLRSNRIVKGMRLRQQQDRIELLIAIAMRLG